MSALALIVLRFTRKDLHRPVRVSITVQACWVLALLVVSWVLIFWLCCLDLEGTDCFGVFAGPGFLLPRPGAHHRWTHHWVPLLFYLHLQWSNLVLLFHPPKSQLGTKNLKSVISQSLGQNQSHITVSTCVWWLCCSDAFLWPCRNYHHLPPAPDGGSSSGGNQDSMRQDIVT